MYTTLRVHYIPTMMYLPCSAVLLSFGGCCAEGRNVCSLTPCLLLLRSSCVTTAPNRAIITERVALSSFFVARKTEVNVSKRFCPKQARTGQEKPQGLTVERSPLFSLAPRVQDKKMRIHSNRWNCTDETISTHPLIKSGGGCQWPDHLVFRQPGRPHATPWT